MSDQPKRGTMKFAGFLLDSLVAPECSTFTSCAMPELAEPENYSGSFFLNNLFIEADPARSLIVVFFRRYAQAVREYRSTQSLIAEYLHALPQTNNVTGLYHRALSHLEQAITNLYLSLMAHRRIGQLHVPDEPRPFEPNDGSPAFKLYLLYTAIKHFDGWIVGGLIPKNSAPIWLAPSGVRCFEQPQGRKSTHTSNALIELSFDDLISIYRDLESDAKFLSEDAYKM